MALARVVAGDEDGDGDATEGDDADAGVGAEVLDTFLVEVLDFCTVEVGTSGTIFIIS